MLSTTLQFLRRPSAWRLSVSFQRSPAAAAPACSQLGWMLLALAVAYVGFRVAWLNDFMVHVDDIVPLSEAIRQNINPFSFADITKLSSFYTYPPGQFYLSLPLALLAPDYPTALLLFRLPSLLLWFAGLIVLWKVLRALWPEQPASHAGVIVLLALGSWRGFIESSQGYTYASAFLMTGVFAWFTLTPGGRSWLVRGPFAAFSTGVLLGLFSWLTYQTVFITAAAFGGYLILALFQRDWRRIGLAILTGLGFAGPFAWVAWKCLRHVLSFASGTPGWAPGLPGSTLGEKLLFPFRGWFDVLQANLTFVPWGLGSQIVATVATGIILAGLVFILLRVESLRRHSQVLWFLAAVLVIFTAGPFFRQFPLGPTRHTFVLQVPVLLAVALGLSAWRLPRWLLAATTAIIATLTLCFMPALLKRTGNHVDFALIEHYFHSNPQSRIVDLPASFTWDITYLARDDQKALDRIRWNNQFANVDELAAFLAAAPTSYLVSHRGPINDATREAMLRAGFIRIRPLAEIPPLGSTEIAKNFNGGNGFFFYALER